MIAFWVWLCCAAGMTLAQDAVPGARVFHTGWYNALDVACIVMSGLALRHTRSAGMTAIFFGGVLIVAAGAASGLMGPQTRTIVGAPGADIPVADAGGRFVFPMHGSSAILLERGSNGTAIGAGRRYTGGLVLWERERTVAQISVADARGRHLTMTQPTNASFLSPVLLLQQRTSIAGMSLRYDTFNVPSLQKSVKAVYFSAGQLAKLHPGMGGGAPALLFDVVPGAIGMVPSGGSALIGGVRISAVVRTYPAVVLASAPFLPILVAGLLLIAGGIAQYLFNARRPARNA